MNKLQKEQIRVKLQKYVDVKGSINKASNSIEGTSPATLSHILSNKWEKIADGMWRSVGAQIGWVENIWNVAKTRDFELLTAILNDAKDNSNVYGIVGREGTGKTEAFKQFANDNASVFWIRGNEFFTPKYFFQELLRMMGKEYGTMSVPELSRTVVREMEQLHHPVVIFDEADKLPDKVLSFFISLYNELEDRVGIVMGATNFLKIKVENGVKKNKRGFREMYSRLGKTFVELEGLDSVDVRSICELNGVTKAAQIAEITEKCLGDIRKIKKLIHFKKNDQ